MGGCSTAYCLSVLIIRHSREFLKGKFGDMRVNNFDAEDKFQPLELMDLVSKLAESQDIKSGKFLVGFSSSLSNRFYRHAGLKPHQLYGKFNCIDMIFWEYFCRTYTTNGVGEEKDGFSVRVGAAEELEFEPDYLMADFGSNPDIDKKPPMPLRNALEKLKRFLMAYEIFKAEKNGKRLMHTNVEHTRLLEQLHIAASRNTTIPLDLKNSIALKIAKNAFCIDLRAEKIINIQITWMATLHESKSNLGLVIQVQVLGKSMRNWSKKREVFIKELGNKENYESSKLPPKRAE
ncbi:hypothetical protein Tco_1172923 [Tanacetum coccineum]